MHNSNDKLYDYIPEVQKGFVDCHAYRHLYKVLFEMLEDFSHVKFQIFVLAKDNFDHLCISHPEYPEKIAKIKEEKEFNEKSRNLDMLYEKMKKEIKQQSRK